MPTSPDAIKRFSLHQPPPLPVGFRGTEPAILHRYITEVGGKPLLTKTAPRAHQLEGLAFALWAERSLLFYEMRTGKSARHDWPVCTPTGWRPIGELKVGDLVMSPSGTPTQVTGVFPQGLRELYKVTFSDGATTVCDKEHLWTVNSAVRRHRGGAWQTKTLAEIENEGLFRWSARTPQNGYKHFIPMTQPVQYPVADLPLDPYLLGALLGDGSLSHHPMIDTDDEIINSLVLPTDVTVRKTPVASAKIVRGQFSGLLPALRLLGLHGKRSYEKSIPPAYLLASVEQRWALLQGLLDTDGGAQPNGNSSNTCWSSTSEQLALDMQELVRSLGGTAQITIKAEPKYSYLDEERIGRPSYQMIIRLPPELGCPFRLGRKAQQWQPFTKFMPQRAIAKIEYAETAHAVCISVADPNGLFVIKDYVVTHNTKLALDYLTYLIYSEQLHQRALIIAHAPIGVDEWENQIPVHSFLNVKTIRSGPQALDRFYDAATSDCDAVLVSWSTLQSMLTINRPAVAGKRKGQNKLYVDRPKCRELARYFGAAVIDEIHMAGHDNTLRFNIAAELIAHCGWRLGLTGTPFGRDPLLLWAQAFLMDGGEALSRSYRFFQEAFCKRKYNHFKPGNIDMVFDPKKLPLLRDKMRAMTLTCELREVQDVNVLAGVVRLNMSMEQLRAYEEVIERLIETRIGNVAEIENSFVRLRQIASGFLPFVNDKGIERIIDFADAAKFVWLEDFAREIPRDMQCVIFHEFIHTGERICKILTKAKISHEWLHGGVKDRPGLLSRFQTGASQILVSNTAAGGMAVDLSAAEYLVFFELPASVIIRKQAEARPLARGGRPLIMDDMVCAPIEQKLLDFVAEGKSLRDALLRDPKGLAEQLKVLI